VYTYFFITLPGTLVNNNISSVGDGKQGKNARRWRLPG
jgi:hypothetical protein